MWDGDTIILEDEEYEVSNSFMSDQTGVSSVHMLRNIKNSKDCLSLYQMEDGTQKTEPLL